MNNKIPSSLLTAFSNKRLIPIVGAGVSMSLKSKNGDRLFPSWRDLLLKAAEKLNAEAKEKLANAVIANVDIEEYESAANTARRGLTGRIWSDFFNEQFNIKKDDILQESLALPSAIWGISNQIITLNYDMVLRLTCPDQTFTEIDNNDLEQLAKFSRADHSDFMVWHMHGHIRNTTDIIFTSESYNKLYRHADSKYTAALNVFRQICGAKHLLFIGCSLDDADLLKEIANQHNLFDGNTGPHYALVKEANIETIKSKLMGLPIELISFSDFGEPLVGLIKEITSSKTSSILKVKSPDSDQLQTINMQSGKRIAILLSKPLDKNYTYDHLINEFKKLKAEVNFLHLSLKALNNLENFDYVFILSKLTRKKVVIEDETLISQLITFKELEDNIGNHNTKGIFVFLDHNSELDLEKTDVESLTLPICIFPQLQKNKVESFSFKIFKRKEFGYFEGKYLVNLECFDIVELKGKTIVITNYSKLPQNIDPRTTRNFVGRNTDLENLSRKIIELRDSGNVLTIKGSGGIGKTITVKKIIVDFASRGLFADGIDFIDCEFIEVYSVFESQIARCFNLDNALNLREAISNLYNTQDRLIVLDNVETLLHITDYELIKQLITFISEYATVIVTTRELIDLDCEQIYELRPFTTDEAFTLFIQELLWDKEITEKEKRLIREDILEAALDNNPLAIKLVTKNIPKGKRFQDLKIELQDDFFHKVTASELVAFDSTSDMNIERKKSLYGSINFSYQYLSEREKIAFELLSLFPDGINLESFKFISKAEKIRQHSDDDKPKSPAKSLFITDPLIKALENKSLVQIDNNEIRLQSIIGKFAEHKFLQRGSDELERYYKNAFEHNFAFVYSLAQNKNRRPQLVMKVFNNHQNNFIKSIRYSSNFEIETIELLQYINDLTNLFATLNASVFIKALEEKKFVFHDKNEQLLYEVIMIVLKYYEGAFEESFNKLKKILPLKQCLDIKCDSYFERVVVSKATNIYSMEGDSLTSLMKDISRGYNDGFYPHELFHLGIFNNELLSSAMVSFFSLDVKFQLGVLTEKEIDDYLKYEIYENAHLQFTQTHFIKAKMGLLTKDKVKKLITVNPYTEGLKSLMFAFIETNFEIKQSLFERAIKNLVHIKYYYVEALYFYANFLKENSEKENFNKIYQIGIQLARKHHYRYLLYKFEQLLDNALKKYDVNSYPLEQDEEIESYVKFLIKDCKKYK